jgi:hypothetical protein
MCGKARMKRYLQIFETRGLQARKENRLRNTRIEHSDMTNLAYNSQLPFEHYFVEALNSLAPSVFNKFRSSSAVETVLTAAMNGNRLDSVSIKDTSKTNPHSPHLQTALAGFSNTTAFAADYDLLETVGFFLFFF